MRHLALHLIATSLLLAVDGPARCQQVADAVGLDAWQDLTELRFTWTHQPSSRSRSYVWHIAEGTVTVRLAADAAELTIPVGGPGSEAEQAAIDAHKAFVNDSYWLLFPLQVAWDDSVTCSARDAAPVPQLPDLGTLPALEVRYPSSGGYTPGDHYVLYLGEDQLPAAWAYHPGGASEPKLVTTWGDWQEVGGLRVPAVFRKPDGSVFITITGLAAH